jgi:hypothetical protein
MIRLGGRLESRLLPRTIFIGLHELKGHINTDLTSYSQIIDLNRHPIGTNV